MHQEGEYNHFWWMPIMINFINLLEKDFLLVGTLIMSSLFNIYSHFEYMLAIIACINKMDMYTECVITNGDAQYLQIEMKYIHCLLENNVILFL